jgi:hypothetical protein
MAKIKAIKQAIEVCMKTRATPFIWGHRGIGKSSIVKQIAAEQGIGFIDLRCSQLEASDIRGLPDKSYGEGEESHDSKYPIQTAYSRTVYLPPADMPVGDLEDAEIMAQLGDYPKDGDWKGDLQAERIFDRKWRAMQPRFKRGILFLDELNRAADDVLQACFQLVLDRAVGQYTLPPGWAVVAAGNFQEGYLTNGFNDPAFLDRFVHMTLSTGEDTLEEWIDYITAVHGNNASSIIEFASQNTKHLDGDIAGDLGFTIQPSRRSWEQVIKAEKVMREIGSSQTVRLLILSGLIGQELAFAYINYNCPVKPKDVINNGVKAYMKELESLQRNQLIGLMWGLVSFCKDKIEDDKVGETCLDFAEYMIPKTSDKDVIVAFCRALVGANADNNDAQTLAATITNPQLAKLIANYRAKTGVVSKNFVDRLAARPALQEILSKTAWGDPSNEPLTTKGKKKSKT